MSEEAIEMTQEMKLLYALCDALGFDVEVNLDYMERKESKEGAMQYKQGRVGMDRVLVSSGPHNKLDIDENGNYTSLLVSPVVDYKLTRKSIPSLRQLSPSFLLWLDPPAC